MTVQHDETVGSVQFSGLLGVTFKIPGALPHPQLPDVLNVHWTGTFREKREARLINQLNCLSEASTSESEKGQNLFKFDHQIWPLVRKVENQHSSQRVNGSDDRMCVCVVNSGLAAVGHTRKENSAY